MKKVLPGFALLALLVLPTELYAHCQVPCGIYDDQLRADLIAEDITTIEKAMQEITELSGQTPINYNQIVRWINTKEFHAGDIQEIVSEYFLTQRIKADTEKYEEKLKVLHGMLVTAMKCKQTTDPANVKELRDLLKQFEVLYFGHSHRE